MRDYDSEVAEDRTFKIGGEVFTYRLFHWTETVDMLEEKLDESLVINDDGSFSYRADTEWCLKEIYKFLDGPEEVKRFKAAVGRKTNPIPRVKLAELYGDLRRLVQALPTTPPLSEPSVNGGGSTEAESSVVSPSTEETSTA